MNPNIVWGIILSVAAAYEAYGITNKTDGDTLSERMRVWFKVRTAQGAAGFTGAWITFAVWFVLHIVLMK